MMTGHIKQRTFFFWMDFERMYFDKIDNLRFEK